jgi:hypothetical protein
MVFLNPGRFWDCTSLSYYCFIPQPFQLIINLSVISWYTECSTIEELLGKNSSGSGLQNWEYSHGDLLCWPCNTLYPQKLALTSLTSGGRSVGIVRLRTKDTDFFNTEYSVMYWLNFRNVFYRSFGAKNVQWTLGWFDTVVKLSTGGVSCNCFNLTEFLLVHCLGYCGCIMLQYGHS